MNSFITSIGERVVANLPGCGLARRFRLVVPAAREHVLKLVPAALLVWASLASAVEVDRPNIVVILVDDAGFMDFGGYGGEARTPAIDALADGGLRFSNYHTSPLCAPSRAMLLTGLSNHRAGVGTIPEAITDEQRGRPGYSLRFEDGVETVATRLKRAGYRTYMTGKWHLGHGEGDLPVAHGFDKSFALDASGADNFEQKSYMPYYKTAPWFEDGKPATLPDDFYSSRFIVDKMVEYLETDSEAPFFAYLAFQAIHIPIQAPKRFIERYEGIYDDGWNVLREKRWQKAKTLGLIDADAPLAPMHASLNPWSSLTAEEQHFYSKSMAVNAAMLEAMDYYIARLVDYLQRRGEFENSIFIITSDNGPEFNEPALAPVMQLWMPANGYNNDVETLGEPGSLAHIGPAWASAAASPGRLFKFYSTEGGLRVPLIVSGPGIEARPGFIDAPAFVTDLVPTILEATGVEPQAANVDGVSLLPLLAGSEDAVDPERSVGIEVSGNAALFHGDYKLARVTAPHGDETWRLFNIQRDPGETHNLAKERPELFADMMAAYDAYAADVGVIPPAPGFSPVDQVSRNTLRRQFGFYRTELTLLLTAFVLITATVAYRRWK